MSKRPRLDPDVIPTQSYNMADQDRGGRMGYSRRARGGYSRRFNPYKALTSGINHVKCVLTCKGPNWNTSGINKHLVSEYDPTKGGYVAICKRTFAPSPETYISWRQLPMHCYDLNFYPGFLDDNNTNFPPVSSAVTDNINSRMWVFGHNSSGTNILWRTGNLRQGDGTGFLDNECHNVRYVIDNAKTLNTDTTNNIFMYRKAINIDMLLYGTQKMETKFDIRVIRIDDERFCPDYPALYNTANPNDAQDYSDVRNGWQNLITPYVVNPLLSGEPNPKTAKKWFTTIAKKTVTVGEQTTNIDTIPTVRTSLRVDINKVYNYAWSSKGFSSQYGANAFDGAPIIENGPTGAANDQTPVDTRGNDTFVHKPRYKGRFYLLIRALCPLDSSAPTGGNDNDDSDPPASMRAIQTRLFDDKGHTTSVTQYIPTYDLVVKTTWATTRNG